MNSKKLFLSITLLMCLFAWTAKAGVTKTVGTTGADFPTLFDAITAVNLNTDGVSYSGAVELQIIDNTIETSTISISASAVRTSLLIYPTIKNLTISGNVSQYLIILEGATNVTFDGRVSHIGGTRTLTITNAGGTDLSVAGTFLFKSDASNNTIKYCTIKGSGTNMDKGTIGFTSNTLGNNNNTISNNLITNADPNYRPNNSIYSIGTSSPNKLNTISNNDFADFCSPSINTNAIRLGPMNESWTISGNSFYESTTFAPTLPVEYNIVNISSGNNYTISGNFIGGSLTKCGGAPWTKTVGNNLFRAINLGVSASPLSNIQNNTIKNINWTNSNKALFYCLNITGGVNIADNTIGDPSTTGSINYMAGEAYAAFYTVYYKNTGTAGLTNNKIGSITVGNSDVQGGPTTFYGLFDESTGTTTISGNTFGSTAVANSIISNASAINQSVYGIRERATGTTTISGNTFTNMTNNSTVDGFVAAIQIENGTNTISGNFIAGLSYPNSNLAKSTNTIYGIDLKSATGVSISNNIISLNDNTCTNMYGIRINTAGSAVNNLYFNTINIGGSQPSGSSSKSYCINSSNSATFNRDVRNNIFASTRSTVGGTKLHYGLFAIAGAGTFNSDYNDYYVAGAGSVLGNFAAIDKNSVPIVTGQTGNDAGSLNLNPGFANAVGSSAVDFKTSAVLAGVAGTGILVDYANVARGATPRMGAYETIISGITDHQMSFPYRLNHTATGIHITFVGEASIELYTIGGQMIDKLKATNSYSHNLNNGVFVIRINGKTSKFIM